MRRIWSRALIALACVLTAVGVLAGVVNRQLLDGPTFAEHADHVRSDTAVSELIGQQISDRVLELNPNLIALRPAIEAVTVALVRSSAFTPIVTAAAQQAHDALTQPRSGALVLRLADLRLCSAPRNCPPMSM
jgi:protein-disulfide isomerase-like protein with CxxC motif